MLFLSDPDARAVDTEFYWSSVLQNWISSPNRPPILSSLFSKSRLHAPAPSTLYWIKAEMFMQMSPHCYQGYLPSSMLPAIAFGVS